MDKKIIRLYIPLCLVGCYFLPITPIMDMLYEVGIGYSYGIAFCLILLASRLIDSEKDLEGILKAMIVVLLSSSVYGLYQSVTMTSIPDHWVDENLFPELTVRVTGGFSNPNAYGLFIALVMPFVIYMVMTTKKVQWKLVYVAVGTLAIASLLLTYSRGAIVALVLGIIIMMLMVDVRFLSVTPIIGVACIIFMPDIMLSRIASIINFQDSSIDYRFEIYRTSLRIFYDNWLFGIGGRPFHEVYSEYANRAYHPHNLVLAVMVQAGIIGLIVFILIFFSWIKKQVYVLKYLNCRRKNGTHNDMYLLAVSIVSSIVIANIYGLFDYPLAMFQLYIYIMIVIMSGIGMKRIVDNMKQEQPTD